MHQPAMTLLLRGCGSSTISTPRNGTLTLTAKPTATLRSNTGKWEAVHDDNEDGNMLSNDNNAPIVLTFCIDLEMVYTHNNTFWSEKSTICQRNISQLAPRVCAGGERIAAIGRPKMAYPDVEKLINK